MAPNVFFAKKKKNREDFCLQAVFENVSAKFNQ